MKNRAPLRTALLLGLAGGLAVFGDASTNGADDTIDQADSNVTKFLGPLRKHDKALEQSSERIEKLLAQRGSAEDADEFQEQVEQAGKEFLERGQAFHKTFKAFLAGETRRGLRLEIDLVRDNVQRVQDSLIRYRQAAGITVKPVEAQAVEDVRKQLKRYFLQEVRKRVMARLESESLRDIVDSNSWREAQTKALAHFQQRVSESVDAEMQKLTGLAFHDRRSLQRAVRERVNQEIERQIGKLLIRITSNQIVIEIAGKFLVGWAQDQLWNHVWPRIRETFREKGRFASRTARSIDTMEQARMRLLALPADAKISQVTAELGRAKQTALASRYLLKDLKRAGDANNLADLEKAIDNLGTTMTFTSNVRFLLDRESLVMRLAEDEKVLADALAELKSILSGAEMPEQAEGKVFFIPPYEYPDEDGGTVLHPQEKPYYVSRVGVFTGLCVADLKSIQQTIDRMAGQDDEDAYLPIPDLVRTKHLYSNYDKDYVLRATLDGQTRYYRVTHRPGVYDSWFGCTTFFGLGNGTHKVKIQITTRDGLVVEREFPIAVQLEGFKDYEKLMERVNRRGRELKEALAKLETISDKDEKGRLAEDILRGIQPGYLPDLAKHGGSREDIRWWVRKKLEIVDLILGIDYLPEGNPTYRTDMRLAFLSFAGSWCQQLGGKEDLALAKEALSKCQSSASQAGKSGFGHLARMHLSLAFLAISTDNDAKTARQHLEKWLGFREKAGEKIDWERERKRWPEVWESDKDPNAPAKDGNAPS